MSQDNCKHLSIIITEFPKKRNKSGGWYTHHDDDGFGIWLNDSTPIKCLDCEKSGTRKSMLIDSETGMTR